jgi:hypothetical protein
MTEGAADGRGGAVGPLTPGGERGLRSRKVLGLCGLVSRIGVGVC